MTCKWCSSTVAASGELKLVPYDAQTSNLSISQKWNQDSALIGSSPIFFLRYGWFGKGEEGNNINNGIGIGGSVGMGLSTLEWVDSLTNISVGDLLSEVSHNAVGPTLCHQQISYSCDSFDAAIAAHINKIIMPKIMDSHPPPFSLQFMMQRKHVMSFPSLRILRNY
ncbi:unnamed protein product [Lactuca saligna]|uniref:Uncharacterized protein n=1 Tax=Lactuca saligna TaxID=75948 RepID=A0AA35V1G6_LACSI|nr:unnamed protein product [Lactuca saligna]